MSWGIITLTKKGIDLSKKLKLHFEESEIYTLPKWNEKDCREIEGNFTDFVGKIFKKYEILIFIMASGIVVRTIAKHIEDKTKDPGIIVMDEKGKFVISLLSGHIGGANEAASVIAEKIGAVPVITTSSDVNDKIAVDMLAKKNGLFVGSMEKAKFITSMIVNEQKVLAVSDFEIELPEYLKNGIDEAEGIIFITNKIVENNTLPYVQLIPKNIVIGIGCKKGIESNKLIAFIEENLVSCGLDKRSMIAISSVDIKKDEKAIIDASLFFNCETVFIDRENIKKIENDFEKSEFVREQIGVGSVSEPAAFLAGNSCGKFLMKKKAKDGMTLTIFEKDIR
jgi:cobalt-precorrin 5A hydrolase